jgi:hypothetical protein
MMYCMVPRAPSPTTIEFEIIVLIIMKCCNLLSVSRNPFFFICVSHDRYIDDKSKKSHN